MSRRRRRLEEEEEEEEEEEKCPMLGAKNDKSQTEKHQTTNHIQAYSGPCQILTVVTWMAFASCSSMA
jgi:hypothetical protein